jgi:hypothetical protein
MFEDRYEEARYYLCISIDDIAKMFISECFLFALKHTPKRHIKNIRRILINLVPVQVSLRLPQRELVVISLFRCASV